MNISTHIYRHYLNLDYLDGISLLETQTNRLITRKINELIDKIKEIKNPIIIFEDHNDGISKIVYHMLYDLKTVCPRIDIYIYGKNKVKGFKKLNFIQKIKFKNKENVIYITPINPIYNVINSSEKFNILRQSNFNIVEQFTVDEFIEAGTFFEEVPFSTETFLRKLLKFKDFCDCISELKEYPEINETYDINFVKLSGTDKDFEIFDKIKDTGNICFYYCDEQKIKDLILCGFNFYVKNKNNCIKQNYNTNRIFKKDELLMSDIDKIKFIGDWTNELKRQYGLDNLILQEDN